MDALADAVTNVVTANLAIDGEVVATGQLLLKVRTGELVKAELFTGSIRTAKDHTVEEVRRLVRDHPVAVNLDPLDAVALQGGINPHTIFKDQ